MGRWKTALVTGASSGIGRAIARRLAADGTSLVVVARNELRLKQLADELHAAHGIEVEVLAADLGGADQRAAVEARLADRDRPIDLCVNNAGFGTDGRFWELPLDRECGEIELNVVALVRLTHAALGPMVERGRGNVLNVSSLASFQPTPTSATYGATKAFVTSWSEALHEELRGTGVSVTALCPGFTHTEFHERSGTTEGMSKLPGFVWHDADHVAADALAATAKGKAVCVPGVLNKAVAWLSAPIPRGLKRRAVGFASQRLDR